MKLNRTDLRKIIYDFNSISNRLLQADFADFTKVLTKFVKHIENTDLIYDYVLDCGLCEQNLAEEFQEIDASYGRLIFDLGEDDEEEVRNVFAILKHIVENNIQIHFGIALGYSSSKSYQDKVKGFNDRVTMVLIRHIERYLTKIGIDMGVDEKVVYSITVQNGQVNIATDNATINASNSVGIDANQLSKLIKAIRDASETLSPDDQETIDSCLEVIEEEAKNKTPRKKFLKTALSGIKAIKGTAEFSAAITALMQFLQTANLI